MYLFLERREGKEKEGEKHQNVVSSHEPQSWGPGLQTQAYSVTGNRTSNPLVSQASTQSIEPHQPRPDVFHISFIDSSKSLQTAQISKNS